MKVVLLVGAYEMSDPAYAVDFGPEFVGISKPQRLIELLEVSHGVSPSEQAA